MLSENGFPSRRDLLADFSHIPLYQTDLAPFGGEVGSDGRAIWAVHRDAAGRETGRETVRGRGGFSFTPGGRKGLFRTPGPCRPRLALVDGPLQAICLAAIEGPGTAAGTTYAAPGGTWTRVAGEAVEALIRMSRPRQVLLGFAPRRDGTCPSRDACAAVLRERFPTAAFGGGPMPPPAPGGGWVEALRAARRGRLAA